jgi:predicted ribosomally synthesized peptide with SipW-like signal peptide
MKTKSKALLLALCAVLLVAASVLGTLAYLTAQDQVTNTFTVGKIALDLWEHEVNADGTKKDTKTQEGNEYDDIMPGRTYSKDPTVTIKADSEAAYVRLMVTVTYNEAADAALGKYNYISWFDWNNAWIQPTEAPATERADGKITRTYEFRYNKVVEATDVEKDLEALFTEIEIPGELTGEELATLENLKINIVAHAIQADGFADADAAWAAFN